MSEIIQWAQVTDLVPIISALEPPDYMYLERVPSGWLDESERCDGLRLEPFDGSIHWNYWGRGRIFGAAYELRWERLDSEFWVVYVGAPIDLPGFVTGDPNVGEAQTTERSHLLWGAQLSGQQLKETGATPREGETPYLEFSVPRVLYYPLSAERVAVRIREYSDPESGLLLYYRWIGLEAANVPV